MIHKQRHRDYYYARVMFALMLILALLIVGSAARAGAAETVSAAPSSPAFSGPAAAHQGEPGAWTCETDRAWVAGDRFGGWSADSDALGQPLPEAYLAVISAHVSQRYYHVVLYSAAYGDLVIDYPFDALQREAGTTYPTGRFDPIGKPTLTYSAPSANYPGGLLRVITGLWGGGGGAEDRGGRIFTWCGISP